MIRQLEMEKCLKDGQIPCRWSPDLGYEYGYPLFNFYPPMPYIVGQVYRTFGFSFVTSAKLIAITQIILSTFFMYLLVSTIFGQIGGIFSALFYTYAPYHALNIYVRGAYNEAWAAVFFPLIFYFAYKLIKDGKCKNIIGIALGYAGLLLSHNPMVLTFTPFFLAWCLFWLFVENKIVLSKKIFKEFPLFFKFLFSGIFALSLTAFFTLPVLFETKYTQVESMFEGYYNYSVHFASISQLFFSNFWSDGPSVWGPNDGMSFMVGYLQWIIPLLIVLFSAFLLIRKKTLDRKIILSLFLSTLGLLSIFMVHNKSTFIWQIFTPIQKIQFPWRFLNHTAFLLSLSVGVLPFILKKYFNKKVSIITTSIITITLIILNLNYFHPIQSGPLTDEEKFSGKAWNNQITSGIYDYLPKTASTAAKSAAIPYIDNIDPKEALINMSGQKKGTDWLYFNLFLNQDAKVTISQLAFPNFEITDKGKKIDYQIEPELGRMVIDLKAGDHQIYVKLQNTPIRIVSNYISLFAWLGLMFYLLIPLWKKLIFKK
ncbi:MAG: hypothetical protein PHP97_00225 [Candidatus Shapirobacteria bacterium]|nr:hypothetical protein [Candidatus Shapirobacteria bacterium]MDD4383361.1 hypothetical protein [Candidatus Shapirobacteria bacterium]